ncbi:MAG: 2-succinyl-5-enolpyruvyl-6-hydroxy-3-cyclohexene-1-carboxylic-acid synthase, partial [Anaerolineae bacterium]|nr:2-succinyl-5-enolpyruvyl-6-hydroxy-3-cyclohexene-1-carboxylic-acid synthase [Anaerolineae bacterium]
GLTAVVISPGSRSTPLTLAFAAQDKIKIYRQLDERSAGFFALGLAVASDKPVALVCTSGTAVANYYPAIIEANMSQVPLLILTGDRPHELRHSGANQTIDQVNIFGSHVLWAVDMPIPQADAPEIALRNVAGTAVRAYTTANGLRKGPVHVNFPFRKPLEPKIEDQRLKSEGSPSPIFNLQSLTLSHGELILTRNQQSHLADLINKHERGLIICGPRCPGGNFAQAVTGLSQISGYPILADALSGVRFGLHTNGAVISGGYETYLQAETSEVSFDDQTDQQVAKPPRFTHAPDVIIRFGAVPTSKWLNDYLGKITPAHRIHIRESGVWADDSHLTTLFLQVNAEQACYQIVQNVIPRLSSAWLNAVHGVETAVWQSIDENLTTEYTDFRAVMDTVALIPANGRLFIGNSLPIRHLDQFVRPSQTPIHVYANRGASGIDGNVSTALGFGAASKSPLVALLGDITFYHDMNGLLPLKGENTHYALRTTPLSPTTIVILNNNSGGIFRRLPIAEIEPPFTDLFLTPHDLDFEHAARLYDLAFVRVTNQVEFRQALGESMYNPVPTLIEVVTNGRSDHERRKNLIKMVNG